MDVYRPVAQAIPLCSNDFLCFSTLYAVLLCIVMCYYVGCIMYYNGLCCAVLLLVEARVYSIKRYSWFKFSALLLTYI